MPELTEWVGRQQEQFDTISPVPVAALSATLDHGQARAVPGQELPAPWHWLYFLPTPTASELDTDGHARRGGFLPPVPLPRRMWAGSRIHYHSPLRVGDRVRRLSRVEAVSHKQGASGELVFVTVSHRVFRDTVLVLEEEQDLVYREAATGDAGGAIKPAPAAAQFSRQLQPDPVLLFRYSALTFNSHRIHYDRDYAMMQEGYRGLVVQGPLTATLLLDLLYREMPDAAIDRFQFRGIRPLVAGEAIRIEGCREGDQVALWVLGADEGLSMQARASLRG
jgi:3-methylfumaryl-CoA hydratase